jgi:hypothetical protein
MGGGLDRGKGRCLYSSVPKLVNEGVKRWIKLAGILAGAHFAMTWAVYGLLKISGFELFTLASLFGLEPAPRHTVCQIVLWYGDTILNLPLAPLSGAGTVGSIGVSILNSVLWGICLVMVVYAVRRFIPGPWDLRPS